MYIVVFLGLNLFLNITTLSDKISSDKTDEFSGSVSNVFSVEKFFPTKLNFVNEYSDKTDENLGQCRLFCPTKNFVRRNFVR